jgi:hypothetical protein
MTLDECVKRVSDRIGLPLVAEHVYDVNNVLCRGVDFSVQSPMGIHLLTIRFNRYHHTNVDNGWQCGSVGFNFSIKQVEDFLESRG